MRQSHIIKRLITGLNNVCACAKIKSNFRANARERDVWFFHVQLNDNWQKTKIFHYFGTYTKIYLFNDVKSDNLNFEVYIEVFSLRYAEEYKKTCR